MTAPDMDVIKEIPGYKVILKAVLKAQIQQLVEQLAAHTEEDSIILTASVHDGTLSHLGTDSGKSFLDDHEDVKSQFLGFCLKYHHQKKQQKEKEEREEAMRKAAASANANMYGGQYMPIRSPRHQAPRYMGPRPVRSPIMRHQPYPVTRPIRAPTMPSLSPLKSANKIDGQTIKIELEDSNDENSNQGLTATTTNINVPENASGSASQSPSQNPPLTPSKSVKLESGNNDNDDDAQSESSNSNIPSEQTTETNLGLDSDLSTLISGANNDTQTETDPNVSVKLEALTESEMELEITGVEPGRPMPQPAQETWDPNVSMGMNFDPTGATGSQGDLSQQGYNYLLDSPDFINQQYVTPAVSEPKGNISDRTCLQCNKTFINSCHLRRHMLIHYKVRSFKCHICDKAFTLKHHLKSHYVVHMKDTIRNDQNL